MFYQEVMESTEVMDESKLAEIEECVLYKNKDYATTSLLTRTNLEDLFQKALTSQQYLSRVQDVLDKMSKHSDDRIRLLLVKKLPRLALLCFVEDKPQYVSTRLCPLLLSCLSDQNEEVRKGCEISLLVLIKGKLLEREILEEKICPFVVETCKANSFSSTVSLMGKMAPLIGKEATEKHFLDVFVRLCSNEAYPHRKECIKSLGDLCIVLGTELTEKHLLNPFVKLCRDENWEVRACCPEVSISVSCTCSLPVRKKILADAFARLLKDVSQSVRMSAYGFLGAFICTFADPSVTKLDYDENGELIFIGQDGCEFRMGTVHLNYSRDFHCGDKIIDGNPYFNDVKGDQTLNTVSKALRYFVQNDGGQEQQQQNQQQKLQSQLNWQRMNSNRNYLEDSNQSVASGGSWSSSDSCWNKTWSSFDDQEANDLYNTFRFWRVPLHFFDPTESEAEPEQDEIRANLNILDNELASLSEKLAECSAEELEEMKAESLISCASSSDSGWNSAETTTHVESAESADTKASVDPSQSQKEISSKTSSASDQEVVPQVLLDSFISMTSPAESEGFEKEMAQDCAYYLPAVALTLGPRNWHHIKNVYKCLAANIQWWVRKTVVSSIHNLALLVGEEIASKDLAPIFEGFIRDLDEVKIGAVEHLADFLKLVEPATRKAFLPRLKDFLETEFDYNWRYREEFGEQLRLLIKLYGPSDWVEHFKPLATLLLCDKVAAVRQKAITLFLELIVNLSEEPEYREKLFHILEREFSGNPSWRRRQIFVHLCSEIARQKALDEKDFCRYLLEPLLLLSKDKVPNVGLCVARCLSNDIVSTGYIGPSSPSFRSITETLEKLKCNEDPDIRYFASECDEQREDPQEEEKEQGSELQEQQQQQQQQEPEQQQERDES